MASGAILLLSNNVKDRFNSVKALPDGRISWERNNVTNIGNCMHLMFYIDQRQICGLWMPQAELHFKHVHLNF